MGGTHYCDVSGEIPWTLRTMDLHKHAQKGKAIIAPSSAVAGAYPDLCVKAMYDKLKADTGKDLRRATVYARGGGSGAGTSGGTLATRCAVEFAMTCRFDIAELPHKGGNLTPTAAGQKQYLRRMIQSGIKFKMGEWLADDECSPPDF